MSFDKIPKVVFVGPAGSGKTRYLRKLQGTFEEEDTYKPTLGAEVHTVDRVNIWDTAGNENYLGLFDVYWRHADIIYVFSPTWLDKVYEKKDANTLVVQILNGESVDFFYQTLALL